LSEKTPVALLTGFLGSGKTTLLQHLLSHPDFGETAVIVNELGEVAIDHHLLRRVDERTVVLGNGCVCCSLRGDLADELRDLLGRRDACSGGAWARSTRRRRSSRRRSARSNRMCCSAARSGDCARCRRARTRTSTTACRRTASSSRSSSTGSPSASG